MYRQMLADPALDLRDRNMVFSPASIALALGMVRAGAKGTTASQIDEVLHASKPEVLVAGLGSLQQLIASRDGTYLDDEGQSHKLALKIANSSFAQQGWAIEPSFLDTIARTFGSGQQLVDYRADPAAARDTINAWVSRQTERRIPHLLGDSDVSIDTRLYLVNAVYLKANWAVPFEDDATTPRPFHSSATAAADVPTMHLRGGQEVPYVKGDGWRATELRYLGPDGTSPLAMTLIMPDDLATFESGLTGAEVSKIAASLAQGADPPRRRRHRRHRAGGLRLVPVLALAVHAAIPHRHAGAAQGAPRGRSGCPTRSVPAPRTSRGSTCRPASDGPIHIGNVIHQANIDVDEKGTEAAAATAIGMDTTAAARGRSPPRRVTLRLDHPFFFALRDLETGAILFAGRVVDPAAVRP